jgi:hypothetical protein
MTKHQEAKAIIIGSFILYLIDYLLDKSQKNKGSVIRLKQAIVKKTRARKGKYIPFIKMSDEAWKETVEMYKDKSYRIAIFDIVEFLAFDNEEIMEKMYGNQFLLLVSNFSLKQTFDGIEPEVLKESREVAQILKKNTEKVLYLHRDELKGEPV